MIELRRYQEEGLNAIWDYFQKGNNGNPVLAWPTGTGKSIVPAIFIKHIMKIWPTQRFLLLTHIKELISQNSQVMKLVWNNVPLGLFSAGLKEKNAVMPVVFAGIQSAIRSPSIFGHRDIIFIDEAHLVSQDESSMYLTFIATMKLINPQIKIIGMSATPFRMGQGYITDGGLFTDIVHNLTGIEAFNRMIAEGYLCPMIPRRTKIELDVSQVGMAKGDFIGSQLQDAVDKKDITYNGLKEVIASGENRRSWLIFASGIEHAEHIAAMLSSFGIDCAAVHSRQQPEYNDKAILAFKNNELRSIVNYSKLTTGFNHIYIDLIADFRPTMSIPLHIQKLGRGTRPALGKSDCLVLDFARNVPRLGPINDPIIPRKKGDKQGEAPVKICDACGTYNHMRVKLCTYCGEEFHFKNKLVAKSGTEEILRSDFPIVETYDVSKVSYVKKGKNEKSYLRATYYCGMHMFGENVFPEHGGYATKLFRSWWRQRHTIEPPKTTDEALAFMNELRTPKKIRVWVNRRYPEILNCEY